MALVAVFAHPDDEAFGPGATLAKFASEKDVYLICVTNGNDKTRKYEKDITKKGLPTVREQELQNSAKILGIKEVFFLDYEDGELRNNIYHEVATKIEKILKKIKPAKLMTFEERGVSGHIDHIFLSMVTTFLFNKLKFTKELYYYCLSKTERATVEDYFIYFPDGYDPKDIDLSLNLTKFWDKKVAAVMAHPSQLEDPNKIPDWLTHLPKKENFLIKRK